MATVINNPGTTTTDSGSSGLIVGVVAIFLVIVVLLFFVFPYVRGGRVASPASNSGTPAVQNTIQQNPPQGQSGSTINVPDKIDVNVQGK